jgi:hypothetical protein
MLTGIIFSDLWASDKTCPDAIKTGVLKRAHQLEWRDRFAATTQWMVRTFPTDLLNLFADYLLEQKFDTETTTSAVAKKKVRFTSNLRSVTLERDFTWSHVFGLYPFEIGPKRWGVMFTVTKGNPVRFTVGVGLKQHSDVIPCLRSDGTLYGGPSNYAIPNFVGVGVGNYAIPTSRPSRTPTPAPTPMPWPMAVPISLRILVLLRTPITLMTMYMSVPMPMPTPLPA